MKNRPEKKMKRVPAEMTRIFSQSSLFQNEGRIKKGKRGDIKHFNRKERPN